jgi:hypothetical protein
METKIIYKTFQIIKNINDLKKLTKFLEEKFSDTDEIKITSNDFEYHIEITRNNYTAEELKFKLFADNKASEFREINNKTLLNISNLYYQDKHQILEKS